MSRSQSYLAYLKHMRDEAYDRCMYRESVWDGKHKKYIFLTRSKPRSSTDGRLLDYYNALINIDGMTEREAKCLYGIEGCKMSDLSDREFKHLAGKVFVKNG